MGVYDDTVFVFMGDNGLLNGENGMVDKRTMHEASIRVPLIVRAPRAVPTDKPRVVKEQVLTVDVAPSLLELCGLEPPADIHGHSWAKLVRDGADPAWRKAWFYEYNYEKQFPYTPNLRGVRTDDWVYMHYPHGDGGPDRHKAELYDLTNDPEERKNLIDNPAQAGRIKELQTELVRLMRESGIEKDVMPLDEGIKQALPDQKIR
jgi:N-acetylglucosamine-6-sulfatase